MTGLCFGAVRPGGSAPWTPAGPEAQTPLIKRRLGSGAASVPCLPTVAAPDPSLFLSDGGLGPQAPVGGRGGRSPLAFRTPNGACT